MALRALESLLQQGVSMDDLLLQLRATAEPSDWSEAWRRCSLLRFFDERSYREALKDSTGPEFSSFVSSPDVYPVDSDVGTYAISPAKRVEALQTWQTDPLGLASFSARMETYCQVESDAYSAFAQELFAHPDSAAGHFEDFYQAADAQFDLATCSLLLEILRARYELLSPRLRDLWNRYDSYYRSRNMFSDDYYRSASYLERDKIADKFDEFWDGSEHWLLRIYGKGGSGKTMFVRWLVARRCIPRVKGREPIAVARVDFDFLSLSSFGARPWLILLPIARQLSPQLPDNPFRELVEELGEFTSVLARAENPNPKIGGALDAKRAWAVKTFQDGLRQQLALIVLDTCEEPLIHRKTAFKNVLEILSKAHQEQCPNLRVILSGRYDVSAKGRLETFEPGTTSVEVEKFDRPESKRYLIEKRGMTPGPLVNAIARQSGGNPFSLGLFADLAASPEGLTVKEVREAPQDEFIYLLDRVILRIPQESVRWLVRYAAIPRELTFDYAEQVLSRLLKDPSADEANEFSEEALAKRYASRKPWPKAKIGELKKVWDDLVQYASNPSWIVWNLEANTLKLQSEVVVPMRKLLRKKGRLFDLLQKDSEKYWLARAKNHPEEFSRCMAEALFHRFHRIGAKSSDDWRKLVNHPRVKTAADRMYLGEAILDSSLLDEKGKPRIHENGGPMVDPDIVLQARFLVATAAVTERLKQGRRGLRQGDADLLVQKFSEQWNEIGKLDAGQLGKAATWSEWVLLQKASVYFLDNRVPSLTGLRKARLPDHLRLVARMLASRISYERVFHGLPCDDADFVKALELSAKLKSTEFPAYHIRYRAGLFHLRKGQLAQAAGEFTKVLEDTPRTGPFAVDLPECFWRLVSILRMRGRWQEARELADRFDFERLPEDPNYKANLFQTFHAIAATQMDLGDWSKASGTVGQTQSYAEHDYSLAALHELAGEVTAQSLHIQKAEDHYKTALELYGEGGLGAARIRILQAALSVAAGDLKTARTRLPKRQSYWQLALEAAAVQIRAGGSRVPALMDGKVGPPELRAQVLAVALANGRASSPTRFLEAFKQLDDPAKFAALVPFGETERVLGRNAAIEKLLPKPPFAAKNPAFAVQSLALANARRFFGDSAGAAAILAKIPKQAPILEWRRLRALHAAGLRFDVGPFVDEVQAEFGEVPLFCVATHVEAAEWLLSWGEAQQIPKLLTYVNSMRHNRINLANWTARAASIEAELAKREQNWEAARNLLNVASEVAGGSGNIHLKRQADAAARRLQRLATEKVPERSLIRAVDEWSFAFQKKGLEVKFNLVRRGGGRYVNKSPGWLGPDLGPLFSLWEWEHRMIELTAFIQPFERHFSKGANRFRAPAGPLAAIPWEYLAPRDSESFFRSALTDSAVSETARWMQMALASLKYPLEVTGHSADPAFLRALAKFDPEPGDVSPHRKLRAALQKQNSDPLFASLSLLEPSRDWQYSHKRGYALESFSLDSVYSRFTREPLNYLDGFRTVEKLPSVFHVAGTFRHSPDGGIVLDAGLQMSYSDAMSPVNGLDARRLASLCLDAPGNYIRPLLIVDAITPSDTDVGKQAILRNMFCAELFESGAARAVLGFGLAKPGHSRTTVDSLIHSLESRHTAGELHSRLLRFRDQFSIPPVLWADDPDLPAFRS